MTYAKTLISAALVATLGSAAFAENLFVYQEAAQTMPTSSITINGITADSDGVVAIYDYSAAVIGELLGSHPVNAGSNEDVVVSFPVVATGNVLAVLYAGEISTPDLGVATLEIDLESRTE